jgi:hypothetical protein
VKAKPWEVVMTISGRFGNIQWELGRKENNPFIYVDCGVDTYATKAKARRAARRVMKRLNLVESKAKAGKVQNGHSENDDG